MRSRTLTPVRLRRGGAGGSTPPGRQASQLAHGPEGVMAYWCLALLLLFLILFGVIVL